MAKKLHADPNSVVTWDTVPGADSYDLELMTKNNQTITTFTGLTTSSILASMLFNGQSYDQYKIQIRSVDGGVPGDWTQKIKIYWQADASQTHDPKATPENVAVYIIATGDSTVSEEDV